MGKKIYNFIPKLFFIVFLIFVTFISLGVILLSFRGNVDPDHNIRFQNIFESKVTEAGSPFEVSISSGRYALVESIVKNRSFIFSEAIAKFASPDVIYTKLGFSSVFTPGVSIVAVPFYLLGSHFGYPQIGTYLLNPFVGLINVFLIAYLAYLVTKNKYLALSSGLIFLFGTNAFSYLFTLTQHHLSISLILIGIIISYSENIVIVNIITGILLGIGVLIDFPNIFLLSSIFIYDLSNNFYIFYASVLLNTISTKKSVSLSILAASPFLLFFGIYNQITTCSPTKLAQFVCITDYFSKNTPSPYKNNQKLPVNIEESKSVVNPIVDIPFKTRKMLNGFIILFLSDERSWLHYAPILLFGIYGFIIYLKNNSSSLLSKIGLSIITVNIITYTMFGDVWGGWAFGPRYLLPSAAILSIFITYPFTLQIKKFWKIFLFLIMLFLIFASININTIASVTTSALPPKQEAMNLLTPIPYDLELNYSLLDQNKSSSLLYNVYFKNYFSATEYTDFITIIIFFEITSILFLAEISKIKLFKNQSK